MAHDLKLTISSVSHGGSNDTAWSHFCCLFKTLLEKKNMLKKVFFLGSKSKQCGKSVVQVVDLVVQ